MKSPEDVEEELMLLEKESPKEKKELGRRGFVAVRSLDLASCLLGLGVPLSEDTPFTLKEYANEDLEWTFNFEMHTSDGKENTRDLVNAFKSAEKFVSENPNHPMTFAVATIKNRQNLLRLIKDSTPFVSMKAPTGTTIMHVAKGGNKHAECLKQNYKQL